MEPIVPARATAFAALGVADRLGQDIPGLSVRENISPIGIPRIVLRIGASA